LTGQPPPLLAVRGLRVERDGRPVVMGVDLDLAEGHVMVVLGPNGAGKTTLLESIAGVTPEQDGSVRLDGREVGRLPAHDRARLGLRLVGQGRQVIPELSLRQNLQLAATGARLDSVPRDALRLFPQLERRGDIAAGQLSGGEQQMLALSMGLLARPRVLILDEPSFGLAPATIDVLFQALRRLKTDGFSMLLSEQHAPRALDLADHVVVLRSGSVAVRERLDGNDRADVLRRVTESYIGGAGTGADVAPAGGLVEDLVAIRLPVQVKRALQVRARAEGREPRELVEAAIRDMLARPSRRGRR